MGPTEQPEIYFHVGLGRTATTFVQNSIFPKLKDIHYIRKRQFRKADEIIASSSSKKYLITHEFSKSVEKELKSFSERHPDARIIIVFRRQDKWIASHYKRSVKVGNDKKFTDYFDLQNNNGQWKKEHLYYFPKIQYIEENFHHKPLVLFHHDLKENPQKFLHQILAYTGVEETEPISFDPRHVSYNDKELKVRQWVIRNTIFSELKDRGYKYRKLRRLYNKMARYSVLFIAKLVHESLVSNEPLIPGEQLEKIRTFYQEDWEKCLEYARENNPKTEV